MDLSNYFRNYYSFSYGHPTDFKIEYLQRDATGTVMIKAFSKDSISYYNIPIIRKLKILCKQRKNQPSNLK
ncbi:MAG: hypothetical protein IPP27_14405 [Bacteroidetes bacterium]|nr:hypothetical protein [Bacteroidota bacterium]